MLVFELDLICAFYNGRIIKSRNTVRAASLPEAIAKLVTDASVILDGTLLERCFVTGWRAE